MCADPYYLMIRLFFRSLIALLKVHSLTPLVPLCSDPSSPAIRVLLSIRDVGVVGDLSLGLSQLKQNYVGGIRGSGKFRLSFSIYVNGGAETAE